MSDYKIRIKPKGELVFQREITTGDFVNLVREKYGYPGRLSIHKGLGIFTAQVLSE